MKLQMLFVWKRKKALTEIQVFYLFFGFSNTNIILIKERNTHHMKVRKSHNKEKSMENVWKKWWCLTSNNELMTSGMTLYFKDTRTQVHIIL